MERKIGEIFEYEGEWYQCINTGNCSECAFSGKRCYDFSTKGVDIIGDCTGRTFKKLEKVGEPYDDCGTILQRFKIYTNVTNADTKGLELHIYSNDTIGIEIKQTNEDMEEKNNGNTPLNVLTDKYVNGDICYNDFEKEVKALYSCKEEIKPTLKEFDLEAAKLGKPVCTRDGRKARIICFDRIDSTGLNLPIVALIQCEGTEVLQLYRNDGKRNVKVDLALDLMMLPEKKEGWVNVYKGSMCISVYPRIYKSRNEAVSDNTAVNRIDTIKISWEE